MSVPTPPADEPVVVKQKLSRSGCAWRIGCVAVWLPLMLLPLALLILAIQGEIGLWHNAGFPSGAEHPFLQAKLLMDIDTRGLNITRSYVSSAAPDNNSVCVQTHVRFVLWQGQGTPVDYCDCYDRAADGQQWTLTSTAPGLCAGN